MAEGSTAEPLTEDASGKAANPGAPQSESIAVFARLKPVGESDTRGEVAVTSRFGKQKSVQVRNIEFSLDWIFTETESQEKLYNIAAHDRVAAVLGGYNSTIMAYGQTGAGKTHTMFGPDEVLTDFNGSDPILHGIVPRASDQIFEGLRHGTTEESYIVQCSYLEVYNNTLNDLLGNKQNLPMREKPGTGLVVEGLTYEVVTQSKEVMANLARGNAKRVVAAMKMNPRSSRGHAIFTMYIKSILAFGGEKAGKLNLVDLAGMESSKKSYAVEGASNNEMRKVEAKNINTSLYALGSVIEKLSEASQKGGQKAHVPYRDAKLTRLLQDSLGGNSKSTIVVALRIESQNIEESMNTLRFAQRAKAVKTVVKDNTITIKDTTKLMQEVNDMTISLETTQLLVRQLQMEIKARDEEEQQRLEKAKLEAASHSGDPEADHAEVIALREEVAVLKHKQSSLLHKSILHRVLKAQSEKAIGALREANMDLVRQMTEAESVMHAKERENRALVARNEELERIIRALQTGGPLPAGVTMPGVDFDDWREDLITKAEAELKAAMSAGDPERLKAAIANASDTVAKARARGSHVLRKQQVLHGDGGSSGGAAIKTSRALEHIQTEADPLTEEEKAYVRFHEIATGRKLALASRGFEVQNIFIDTLYDAAVKANVPTNEWGEFVRLQLASPRSDADDAEEDDQGNKGKVGQAFRNVARLVGWRANFAKIAGIAMTSAAPLMERPDDMPLPEGEGEYTADAAAGRSLHAEANDAAGHVADAHLGLLSLADPEQNGEPLTPNGSVDVSRAQRYRAKLLERADARDQARKDSHRG
uniref:Kinesin motor domain-containing protein n=2 Tax=Haptolina brevifila TaxID=156173 RepID=A0A7S2N7Q3_9EUKA|mmetsp:Transcript_69196/g.137225  ORF Transcript_69196/g.137225 Transcript_69196/m.137225 type:complete len:820 (+) Transcript_69196:71-2530(+)